MSVELPELGEPPSGEENATGGVRRRPRGGRKASTNDDPTATPASPDSDEQSAPSTPQPPTPPSDGIESPAVNNYDDEESSTPLSGDASRGQSWGQYFSLCKQQFFHNFTQLCFPKTPEVNPRPTLSTKTEIASSLTLHIVLYYNMLFSMIWILLFFGLWVWKQYHALRSDLWVGWMFVCTCLIEIIRLWMGYEGNINEQVADVSGFWLLCMVKTGFTVFFLNGQYLSLPLDDAINTVMLIFDVTGVIIGYFATRNLIKSESTRFYMNQLWGTEGDTNETRPHA